MQKHLPSGLGAADGSTIICFLEPGFVDDVDAERFVLLYELVDEVGLCQTDHDVAMGRNANVGNKGPSGLVAAHRAHNDERGAIEDLLAAYALLHVASLSIDRSGRFRNA